MGLTFLLKERVPDNFYGIRDFPYLKLGIQDCKAKSRRDLGLKVCAVGGMPKMTFGIPGLHEIWGRDYGIEEPYWGPSMESGAPVGTCLGPEKAMGSLCACEMFITFVDMISPCL